ncbi:DUF4058 family protein [Leptolyngbya sp. KIOST-1]|uniref:DUF4058 family protein n=1 Tax=Leptolyngbya sp. KIOST-1 TaxID=1229172 RepID=UPI000907B9A6|nr:DUF4058 family protein [Leptolyngbya sp. KIOST-1]
MGGRYPSQGEAYNIFSVQNAIPTFALPLRSGDPEPIVDLQSLLNEIYNKSSYDLKLDYSAEPVPPLSEADADWFHKTLSIEL